MTNPSTTTSSDHDRQPARHTAERQQRRQPQEQQQARGELQARLHDRRQRRRLRVALHAHLRIQQRQRREVAPDCHHRGQHNERETAPENQLRPAGKMALHRQVVAHQAEHLFRKNKQSRHQQHLDPDLDEALLAELPQHALALALLQPLEPAVVIALDVLEPARLPLGNRVGDRLGATHQHRAEERGHQRNADRHRLELGGNRTGRHAQLGDNERKFAEDRDRQADAQRLARGAADQQHAQGDCEGPGEQDEDGHAEDQQPRVGDRVQVDQHADRHEEHGAEDVAHARRRRATPGSCAASPPRWRRA